MIISLNGFNLNDGISGAWLNTEIAGLEMPTIRTSSGNFAGRDGGYVGAQYYSARDITIQGTIFSSDTATLEQARINIQAALLGSSVTMGILTNAGNSYTVYCNLLDFQMPIKQGLFNAPFKIELLAPDPTIYSNSSATIPVNVPKVTSGGYNYPVVYPVVYAAGTLPTTITNAGNILVYPIITLTGIATNPMVTNNTTLQFFSLALTTGSSDQIIINMAQRTVLLNGSSIFADIIGGSTWWSLKSGGNAISLSSAGGGDTVSSTISWQSGYMGI